MSQFILDTDHLTLLRKAHPDVVIRAVLVPRDEIATTVIKDEKPIREESLLVHRHHRPSQNWLVTSENPR